MSRTLKHRDVSKSSNIPNALTRWLVGLYIDMVFGMVYIPDKSWDECFSHRFHDCVIINLIVGLPSWDQRKM